MNKFHYVDENCLQMTRRNLLRNLFVLLAFLLVAASVTKGEEARVASGVSIHKLFESSNNLRNNLQLNDVAMQPPKSAQPVQGNRRILPAKIYFARSGISRRHDRDMQEKRGKEQKIR